MTAVCNDQCHTEFLGLECAWPNPAHRLPRRGARRAPCIRRGRGWVFPVAMAMLLSFSAWHLGSAGYIQAKAWLAQRLIEGAWAQSLETGRPTRPWPWADTWPVARLVVSGRAEVLYVLAGASGRTLAFGPGHLDGSAAPGESGNTIVAGHRDTHFAFLRDLAAGGEIEVQDIRQRSTHYRVTGGRVVDKGDVEILAQPTMGRYLTLVTCYPFDALRAGGPLRYVVTARAVGGG